MLRRTAAANVELVVVAVEVVVPVGATVAGPAPGGPARVTRLLNPDSDNLAAGADNGTVAHRRFGRGRGPHQGAGHQQHGGEDADEALPNGGHCYSFHRRCNDILSLLRLCFSVKKFYTGN